LIPLVLLLTLAIKKVPAYPAIGIGALAGIVIAVTYQIEGVSVFVGAEEGTSQLLILIKGSWQALFEGYHVSTGLESLDELLSRGGMASMVSTVWLIITAMTFGASMEKTGLLHLITGAILKGVKGTGSLILTTVLTAIGVNIFASDQYMSIVLPGRMYRVEFAKRGLAPENLSRTIEDAGTMTSALVPWNTCGAFMAGALGVPTLAYAPYAFLNLLNPVIAVFYGFTNIALVKIDPSEGDPTLAPEPAE
jgi:NhaC family Na+:H+ antiporter